MLDMDIPPIASPFISAKRDVLNSVIADREVDPDLRWRLRYTRVMNRLLGPLRYLEERFYDDKVRQVEIAEPPVMIIGHWRSGTTHLHYLMDQDPRFASITNIEAAGSSALFVLARWLEKLSGVLPTIRRPMDNLPVGIDMAQEEEFAVASRSDTAMYFHWMYLQHTREIFDRAVLFENMPDLADEYAAIHKFVLQQATMLHGKRILLKNPPSTGRVKLLTRLYPGAKFIFLHRDPYQVFRSTRHLYEKMENTYGVQRLSPRERDETVLYVYGRIMQRYLDERSLIPPDQLLEVSYDELDRDGMGTMRRIYETLDLPGWAQAEPHFKAYLDSQQDYQKNKHRDDPEVYRMVNEVAGPVFDAFGYERRGEAPVQAMPAAG